MNVTPALKQQIEKNSTIPENSTIPSVQEIVKDGVSDIQNLVNDGKKDNNETEDLINNLNNKANEEDENIKKNVNKIIDSYENSDKSKANKVLFGQRLYIYANPSGINKARCEKTKLIFEEYINKKGLKGNKIVVSEYSKSIYLIIDEGYKGNGVGIDYIYDKTEDIIDNEIGQGNINLYMDQIDSSFLSLNNITKENIGSYNSKTIKKLELLEKLELLSKVFALMYSKMNSKIGNKYSKEKVKDITNEVLKNEKKTLLKMMTRNILIAMNKRGDGYSKTYKNFLRDYVKTSDDGLMRINGLSISEIKKTMNNIEKLDIHIPKIGKKIVEGKDYIFSKKEEISKKEYTNNELIEINNELSYKAKSTKRLSDEVDELLRHRDISYKNYTKATVGIYNILKENFEEKIDKNGFLSAA